LVLTAAVALLVQSTYKPDAPVEESGMFVDGEPAPTTIAGLKAHADAVLLVTYSGQHRTLACERPYCPVSSLYAFEIRETLKSHAELSNGVRRFWLELPGGIEESRGFVTHTFVYGRRDPIPLHRYIIFAVRYGNRWIPATGHAGGKDSIYDVSDERAISLSTEEWDNTSPPLSRELLDELRRN